MKGYFALVIAGLLVGFYCSFLIGTTKWDTNQRYFPCNEDEVLGFNERSTSHVVCIHVEDVK